MESAMPDQLDDGATPSADSPPGGGRGRSPLLGLVLLVAAVALLILFMLGLFGGGTGPTR